MNIITRKRSEFKLFSAIIRTTPRTVLGGDNDYEAGPSKDGSPTKRLGKHLLSLDEVLESAETWKTIDPTTNGSITHRVVGYRFIGGNGSGSHVVTPEQFKKEGRPKKAYFGETVKFQAA